MGNKPFRLALKLDKTQYDAGDVIKGQVYLSVDKEASLSNVEGIHLLLEGYEHVEVDHHHHHGHDHHSHNRRVNSTDSLVDRSTNTLVHTDYPIVKAAELKVGQYEYGFQWKLPPDLPSSLFCAKSGSRSSAEIRYTLTAYLKTTRRHSRRDTLPRGDCALCIRAKPSAVLRQQLLMEKESYPIRGCLFWNVGQIHLGFMASSDTASPNDTIALQVVGDNQSPAKVDRITCRLIETVTWLSTSRHKEKTRTVTRTLAEQHLAIHGLACWQTWYNPNAANHTRFLALPAPETTPAVNLKVPSDTRDSYSGRLIQVRHLLSVTVETHGCNGASPESSCQIRIVKRAAPETSSSQPENTYIPVAQVLSTEWGPVVADAVEIPEAAAVLLDEELAVPVYAQRRADSGVAMAPSAPDESLLLEQIPFSDEPNKYSETDLHQLLTLVRETPESLTVALQDGSWTILAQNLTPHDYGRVVVAAGPSGAAVANTLARAMRRRFECRHVLACLWTIPERMRMGLLHETAPLASDLAWNKVEIENELSPKELIHFRSALAPTAAS